MSVPKWYQNAIDDLGLTEGKGAANNPAVVATYKYTGYHQNTKDSVPWCGAAMAKWMANAGIKYNKTMAAAAASWLDWGVTLKEPIIGAVGVKKRTGGNHVFLFAGYVEGSNKTKFKMLGANQGGGKASGHDGAVTMSVGNMADVTGWRWPAEVPLPVENQKLRKSGVMQGATLSGVAGTTLVVSEAPKVIEALKEAESASSGGTVLGVVIGVVIVAAALYVIWSRIQGAKEAQSLSETQ